MAGTIRPIRIIRPWKQYSVGHIIAEPTNGLREVLIKQGFAELAEAETPARPAKLGRKAADKLKDAGRDLLGAS